MRVENKVKVNGWEGNKKNKRKEVNKNGKKK